MTAAPEHGGVHLYTCTRLQAGAWTLQRTRRVGEMGVDLLKSFLGRRGSNRAQTAIVKNSTEGGN